ncbi:DUF4253 domain-containing protein [Dactylosporangium siamense]|uniref:DUF4253 domain-containing protein n=1 Tax=Dactylosporangium siamense TaxID=685454 RepID=A0A919PJE9_9ACTN|nr:DUF4253 domain-containing protein [Dactylosporangium siamense]GIG45247.1 hypothetical protein Dsi01nite_032880 [Dactylosporangium siamense]
MSELLRALSDLAVPLPPGHTVLSVENPAPMLWRSDGPPTAELVRRLRAEHPRSGLWPLLLTDQPLELFPEFMSTPDAHDAAFVLAGFWHTITCDGSSADTTVPYGQRWPRPAPPGRQLDDPDEFAGAVLDHWFAGPPRDSRRLGLVPAPGGADALTAMGWMGAANRENDTAMLSAVLRSWEDRFGIRVLHLDSDTVTVSVAAPPDDLDAALHLAAEHFAFCPDTLWQGHPHTIGDYAPLLLEARVWSFWWD